MHCYVLCQTRMRQFMIYLKIRNKSNITNLSKINTGCHKTCIITYCMRGKLFVRFDIFCCCKSLWNSFSSLQCKPFTKHMDMYIYLQFNLYFHLDSPKKLTFFLSAVRSVALSCNCKLRQIIRTSIAYMFGFENQL